MRTRLPILLALLLTAAPAVPSIAQTLKVLVTNDDGVGAPGIDALVNKLAENANLAITVIAPATNQSGTGDQRTTAPIDVSAATTASGVPAKAVASFPADSVMFGVVQELQVARPDLVVSGVNNGQNMSGEIIPLSGTVGAALWAARLGIPAFAVSAGLGASPNFADAATFTAVLVEQYRIKKGFQKKMVESGPPLLGVVLNINFPTCTAGAVRGVRVVGVERYQKFASYMLLADIGGVQTWQATQANGNPFASDCTSTLENPETDLAAMNNGFASVTPLDADRGVSGRKLKDFKFVEKLF